MSVTLAILAWAVAAAPEGMVPVTLPIFADARQWYAEECTVANDPAMVPPGVATSVRIHIDVNHFTGEKAYPIGWPRSGMATPTAWDWSGYDLLTFQIRAATSREKLPTTPGGLIFSMPDKSRQYLLRLPSASGVWTEVAVPIEALPNPRELTRIQFYLSEGDYQHGDTVDLWIADLTLWRYAQPTIREVRPLERVLDTSAGYLVLEVLAAGFEAGQTQAGRLLLRRGQQALGAVDLTVQRGKQRLVVPLPKLAPGTLTLAAELGGRETATATVELVASPYGEK